MADALRLLDVAWPAPARVRAAFTTRTGGVSVGAWQGLNLATHVGDDPQHVARNRALLATTLQLPTEPAWLEQVHGDAVADLDLSSGTVAAAAPARADAALTRAAGRVAAVMVADCVPILLCDCAGQEVAAVHAGWRGLAQGIIARAVAQLRARPADVLAWIGPAIGIDAYQVDAELHTRFVRADRRNAEAFIQVADHWHCDLAGLARLQLQWAGIGTITAAGRCVHAEPEHFYSYRRDGITGRMAALIWLRPD